MIGPSAPQSERPERALSLLLWHSFALGVSESNRPRTTTLRPSGPCFDEVRKQGHREHGHHVSLLRMSWFARDATLDGAFAPDMTLITGVRIAPEFAGRRDLIV